MELLGQLVAAQFDLENVLTAMSSGDAAAADSQLRRLTSLQRQIGRADAGTLAGIRGDVIAAVAQTAVMIQQERSSARAEAASPQAKARHLISDTARDYYERRVFEPYLRFASAEDEAAYRKRERETEEAIKREQAKGTPEGDRNAAALLKRQLLDAGAHGADASPDYPRVLQQVGDAEAALAEAERDISGRPSPPEASAGKAGNTKPTDAGLDDVLAALHGAGVTTDTRVGSGHGLRCCSLASHPLPRSAGLIS